MRGATTTFRKRPRLIVVFLVFGAALIVQGLATAAWFLATGEGDELRWVAVGLGVFLALVGLWFAGSAFRRMRDPADPIVIGPAGILDRAISARPIAWQDVRNLHIWDGASRGGPIVAFDVADGAEDRAAVHRPARLAVRVNRSFGYSYYIRRLGTDATVERLCEAIRPYAGIRGDPGG